MSTCRINATRNSQRWKLQPHFSRSYTGSSAQQTQLEHLLLLLRMAETVAFSQLDQFGMQQAVVPQAAGCN